jgi:molybdopterin synthase sulfur carrier subunit
MQVLVFGSLTDIVAPLPNDIICDNTEQLVGLLEAKYPAIKTTTYFIAVNGKMVRENTSLQPTDTVALMPPFSGG